MVLLLDFHGTQIYLRLGTNILLLGTSIVRNIFYQVIWIPLIRNRNRLSRLFTNTESLMSPKLSLLCVFSLKFRRPIKLETYGVVIIADKTFWSGDDIFRDSTRSFSPISSDSKIRHVGANFGVRYAVIKAIFGIIPDKAFAHFVDRCHSTGNDATIFPC